MPVLKDPRHETFALNVARGQSLAQAYTGAGYSPNGARQHAHRLIVTNPDVSLRVQELRIQISQEVSAGVIAREISDRNARIAELQARWNWLRDQVDCIAQERGAALATEAAGGGTGLLIKEWIKGNETDHAVYRIDTGLLELIRLLLEHEKRAAEELAQCGARTGRDPTEVRLNMRCLTDKELALLEKLYDKMLVQ